MCSPDWLTLADGRTPLPTDVAAIQRRAVEWTMRLDKMATHGLLAGTWLTMREVADRYDRPLLLRLPTSVQ